MNTLPVPGFVIESEEGTKMHIFIIACRRCSKKLCWEKGLSDCTVVHEHLCQNENE